MAEEEDVSALQVVGCIVSAHRVWEVVLSDVKLILSNLLQMSMKLMSLPTGYVIAQHLHWPTGTG